MIRRFGNNIVAVWNLSALQPAKSSSHVVDPKTLLLQEQLQEFADRVGAFDQEKRSYSYCVDNELNSLARFVQDNIDDLSFSENKKKGFNIKPEFGSYFHDIFEKAFDCGELKPCLDVIKETFDNAPSSLKKLVFLTDDFGGTNMSTVYRHVTNDYTIKLEEEQREADKIVQFPAPNSQVA